MRRIEQAANGPWGCIVLATEGRQNGDPGLNLSCLTCESGQRGLSNAPVPRPTTQPCTVTLFQNYDFNDFNPPVDCNGSIFEERIQEGSVRPGAASSSAKTGAAITRVPRLKAVSRAFWANELREGFLSHKAIITVRINRRCHCPRRPRNQRPIPSRPEPIPGLPIPRYLANELLVLTARTRTPCSSLTNTKRSPARTPRARRTSRGTVTCPLLVSVACFCIPFSKSLLYHDLLTLMLMAAYCRSRVYVADSGARG